MTSKPLSKDAQKQAFEQLCAWIEEHLDEPIGWQELMRESGLEFQLIHQLFFKYASTSPMTWIRRQRELRSLAPRPAGLPALLQGKSD
jgi:methylphosphotriester-DNA--protein-cysteine methyltransferase